MTTKMLLMKGTFREYDETETDTQKVSGPQSQAVAEAEGDARALAVLGESIKQYGAEAARVKNQTLWIEKWDGKLPTTSAGNNAALMLGVGEKTP